MLGNEFNYKHWDSADVARIDRRYVYSRKDTCPISCDNLTLFRDLTHDLGRILHRQILRTKSRMIKDR